MADDLADLRAQMIWSIRQNQMIWSIRQNQMRDSPQEARLRLQGVQVIDLPFDVDLQRGADRLPRAIVHPRSPDAAV